MLALDGKMMAALLVHRAHLCGRSPATSTSTSPACHPTRRRERRTDGTNRLLVSLYAPFPYNSATLDGEPMEMTLDTEQGWTLMGHTVDIAPGATRTLEMTFSGVLDRVGPDVEPVVMLPNLARPATFTLNDVSPAVDGT